MKAKILVTDHTGKTFEGEIELVPGQRSPRKRSDSRAVSGKTASVDFGAPERHFVKQHARGMSGAKKFTLILSYMTKGKTSTSVGLKEIEKRWNRMTGLLGGKKFNRAHSNRAKDNGWVDSPNKGHYVLTPRWKEILLKG